MSHVKNVAIVGASGSVGKYIVDHVLKAGKHNLTALTRADSQGAIPDGVKVAKVNYDDHSSLVEALRGQEVLIITMSVRAPPESQYKLIDAAAEAGVPFIFHNTWGTNTDRVPFADDIFLGPADRKVRKYIEDTGKCSWIGIVEGFWYEFSLGGSADRYGFDFENRSVVFFDDGKQPINTTTWPQTGRAMARLLSLPTESQGAGDETPTLSSFKNKFVYISSFYISQKDMFESVLRVTGTKPEDWKISYESSKERYEKAVKSLQEGDREAFARVMYTRTFYPDGSSTHETDPGTQNELLELPKEDLDEFTKIGISRAGLPY